MPSNPPPPIRPLRLTLDSDNFNRLPNLGPERERSNTEICRILLKQTEWFAHEESGGRVQILTGAGMISARCVMDLVDWLAYNPIAGLHRRKALGEVVRVGVAERRCNEDDGVEEREEGLQQMSEVLERTNTRLKATLLESREGARDVCADVFALRNQLDDEKVFHALVVNGVKDVVGVDAWKRIEREVDRRERDGCLGPEYNPRTERKRKLEETTTTYHIATTDSRDRATKRRRVVPRTILDYSSNENQTDASYSDSNGTERDFDDDPFPFCDRRGRSPNEVLRGLKWTRESSESYEEETDFDDSDGMPWNIVPDLDDTTSDSDYEPPEWDMEDVWELEECEKPQPEAEAHPLLSYNLADEALDNGGWRLSDDDLSTDDLDRDDGYTDPGFLQPTVLSDAEPRKPYRRYTGPCLAQTLAEGYNRLLSRPFMDSERLGLIHDKCSRYVEPYVSVPHWHRTDMPDEQTIGAVFLDSQQPYFDFHEDDWRLFEDPVM